VSSGRLRRGNWSVQELERLRSLLPIRGVASTAVLLRRSAESVQRKAMEMLKVPPRKGDWTDSDDWQLRLAWGAVELRLLAPMLGRPANEVRSRAGELRQRKATGPWSREELRLLKKLYGTRTNEDLEVCLMRGRVEIAGAAQKMCLAKDKRFRSEQVQLPFLTSSPADLATSASGSRASSRMPRWTSTEVDRLREMYPDQDNLSVARALGRTVVSVANKAYQLNLCKSPEMLADIGRLNIAHRYAGSPSKTRDVAAESTLQERAHPAENPAARSNARSSEVPSGRGLSGDCGQGAHASDI
jgi:hypothetical protein